MGDDECIIGFGRDLAALQTKLSGKVKERFSTLSASAPYEKTRLEDWSVGDLPEKPSHSTGTPQGYPGLEDDGSGVNLRLWPDPDCAKDQHRLGVARLFRITHPDAVARVESSLFASNAAQPKQRTQHQTSQSRVPAGAGRTRSGDGFGSLANAFGDSPKSSAAKRRPKPSAESPRNDGNPVALPSLSPGDALLLGQLGPDPRRNKDDLVTFILMETLGVPRTEQEWREATKNAISRALDAAARVCGSLEPLLRVAESVVTQLGAELPGHEESMEDAREHCNQLLRPGWILGGEFQNRLIDLRGLELRLTRMKGSPAAKDLAKMSRYREAARDIWAEDTACPCGKCRPGSRRLQQIERDFDARLKEFAQELRGRRR